jgi:APA family basic amino acid/polyamine antiporter
LLAAIVGSTAPSDDIGRWANIGPLLAFVIVCVAVMVLRKTTPSQARPFRTPWVPVVPILGILFNGYMMYNLGRMNWYRLIGWLAVGLVIYFFYSRRHSNVQRGSRA